MYVIEQHLPNYRNIAVHESYPGNLGASRKLRARCKDYTPTHYFPADNSDIVGSFLNINLQDQNFNNEVFDLVITQDVFEHLPDPKKALLEIQRTLKTGGYFISTIPLVNKFLSTTQKVKLEENQVVFLGESEYHGNPIDGKGSPVFWHYGYDIAGLFTDWSSLSTLIIQINNERLGIEAEFTEILVCHKRF